MKTFTCWRNDQTHRAFILVPLFLRAALIRLKPHTTNIYFTAEREIPEWAISQLNSTCYEVGNRTLNRLIATPCCMSGMTYRDLDLTYRLIALAALKSSVRQRAQKALDIALDYLSYATVVSVRRDDLPIAFGNAEDIATYRSCMGSGEVYLPLRSIFSLIDSIEYGTFATPLPGRKFVLNLERQVALYRGAFRLVRGI